MSADWNQTAIEKLRRLWGIGWTASMIEAALNKDCGGGFTRNSVIGKASRLGLAGRPNPKGKSGPVRGVSREREPYNRDTHRRVDIADRSRDNNPRGMLQTRLSRAADAERKPHVGANTFLFAARPKQAQTAPSAKAELARVVPPKTLAPRESDYVRQISRNVPHPAARGVPFAELDARGCKWATTPHHVAPDQHRFCGAPRDGFGPWCPHHAIAAKGRDANPVPVSQRAVA